MTNTDDLDTPVTSALTARPAVRVRPPFEGKLRLNGHGWQIFRCGCWHPYDPPRTAQIAAIQRIG